MVRIKVEWNKDQIRQLMLRLYATSDNIGNVGGEWLEDFGKLVIEESQHEVPIRTMTLYNSAYVEHPRVMPSGKGVYVKIGYGGLNDKRNPETGEMASQYALKVHETKGTGPGGGNYYRFGKWKFLEEPLRRNKRMFQQIIGVKLRALLNKGGAVKHV
jgi:hypothetical protein